MRLKKILNFFFYFNHISLNSMSTKNMKKISNASLKFEWTKGHFVIYGGLALIKADKKALNLKFIRSKNTEWGGKQGKILYETVLYPRNNF